MKSASPRISAHKRGYTARWQKCRRLFLQRNPICVMCFRQGLYVVAVAVDHIIPDKGNDKLFWDENNWQALCKIHHDSTKQAEERRGYSSEVDLSGWPVDPAHPGNKR